MIPEEHWGVVVTNYRELYGDPADYTTQLRALESAVAEKPHDPARHFLAGFHYGYLGFPKQATAQLDKTLEAQPHDDIARQLRAEMQSRLETGPHSP